MGLICSAKLTFASSWAELPFATKETKHREARARLTNFIFIDLLVVNSKIDLRPDRFSHARKCDSPFLASKNGCIVQLSINLTYEAFVSRRHSLSKH